MNIVGDCYVSHRDNTDLFKIAVVKNMTQEFRSYYKKYKEVQDEIKKQKKLEEEEAERKKKEAEENERRLEEEARRLEEENNSKDEGEKKDSIDANNSGNNTNKRTDNFRKETKTNITARSKESSDKADKDDKNMTASSKFSKQNVTMSKDKDFKETKDAKAFGGNNLNILNDVVKEEDENDNYGSKALLDIIKSRFTNYQESVENYILTNEKYYSKNRKRFYCIIPIDVFPPKVEDENDGQ